MNVEVENETSPPTISAFGRGRCRAPGVVTRRLGASLSDAAGALDRRFSPGGSADIHTRLIAQWLSERLGQQFIIENRPGAGTNIALQAAANSQPDGYTLVTITSSNASNATLYESLPFNFQRDLIPIAALSRGALVLEVNPLVPVKPLLNSSPIPRPMPA